MRLVERKIKLYAVCLLSLFFTIQMKEEIYLNKEILHL